jgi:transcriptional regulator with XRE-family HTH domain
MTQDVLADAIKCDRRTIQRAEEGKRLRLETLAGLASVFDVTVSEITVEGPTSVEEQNSAQDKNAVVLRRTASGKGSLRCYL